MKTALTNNSACKGAVDWSFLFAMSMMGMLVVSFVFLVANIIKTNRANAMTQAIMQEEQGTHLAGVCTVAQSLPSISIESKILSCSVPGNQLSWISRHPVSTLGLVSLNDLYRARWRIAAVFSVPTGQMADDGKTSLINTYYVIDKPR